MCVFWVVESFYPELGHTEWSLVLRCVHKYIKTCGPESVRSIASTCSKRVTHPSSRPTSPVRRPLSFPRPTSNPHNSSLDPTRPCSFPDAAGSAAAAASGTAGSRAGEGGETNAAPVRPFAASAPSAVRSGAWLSGCALWHAGQVFSRQDTEDSAAAYAQQAFSSVVDSRGHLQLSDSSRAATVVSGAMRRLVWSSPLMEPSAVDSFVVALGDLALTALADAATEEGQGYGAGVGFGVTADTPAASNAGLLSRGPSGPSGGAGTEAGGSGASEGNVPSAVADVSAHAWARDPEHLTAVLSSLPPTPDEVGDGSLMTTPRSRLLVPAGSGGGVASQSSPTPTGGASFDTPGPLNQGDTTSGGAPPSKAPAGGFSFLQSLSSVAAAGAAFLSDGLIGSSSSSSAAHHGHAKPGSSTAAGMHKSRSWTALHGAGATTAAAARLPSTSTPAARQRGLGRGVSKNSAADVLSNEFVVEQDDDDAVLAGSQLLPHASPVAASASASAGVRSTAAPVPSTPATVAMSPRSPLKQSARPMSVTRGDRGTVLDHPPLGIVWLAETCVANMTRLGLLWDTVSAHAKLWSQNPSPAVRSFGLQLFSALASHVLSSKRRHGDMDVGGASTDETDEPPVSSGRHRVEAPRTLPSQASFLAPVLDYWKSPFEETRLDAIRCVHRVLEEAGHCLTSGEAGGWFTVLVLLQNVVRAGGRLPTALLESSVVEAGDSDAQAGAIRDLYATLASDRYSLAMFLAPPPAAVEGDSPATTGARASRSTALKQCTAGGLAVVQLAFRTVRLVVDELCEVALSPIPRRGRVSSDGVDHQLDSSTTPVCGGDPTSLLYMARLLVAVVSTCIEQQADMNIALTAVTSLWTVTDAILSAASHLEEAQPASTSNSAASGSSMQVWELLFEAMAVRCRDERPEVRAQSRVVCWAVFTPARC